MEKHFQILIFLSVIFFSLGEIVKYNKCSNHGRCRNLIRDVRSRYKKADYNCTVTQVRVTPCAEAAQNKPCNIKRGKTAKIEFDYEPGGSYDGLETRAYWATGTGDLPWIGMDTDGCSHTACPTNPVPETFSYDLQIGSKLPARPYDVKWRLWKENAMECCFLIKIKLVK